MEISDKTLIKLLTKKEKRKLIRRFEILQMLKKGVRARKIADEKNTSLATIVELKKRFLPHLFQKEKSHKRVKEEKKELPWLLG